MSVRIPGLEVYDDSSSPLSKDSDSEVTESSTDEETAGFERTLKFFKPTVPPVFEISSVKIGKCPGIEEFPSSPVLKKFTPPVCYFSAKHQSSGKEVTLIKYDKLGGNTEEDLNKFLNEVIILRQIHRNSKNIHLFYEVIVGKDIGGYFLAFEEFDFFLQDLMTDEYVPGKPSVYEKPVVKSVMKQIFTGLYNLHLQQIVHRDIHPENLVLARDGSLKISNFRNACKIQRKPSRNKMIDFRYQPLDMILDPQCCNATADIWSAICIFAHLLLKRPLFQNKQKHDVIGEIFDLLGYPTKEIWPGFSELPDFPYLRANKTHSNNYLDVFFGKNSPQSFASMDLLQIGLIYNSSYRATAEECLHHPYFQETPFGNDEQLGRIVAHKKVRNLVKII